MRAARCARVLGSIAGKGALCLFLLVAGGCGGGEARGDPYLEEPICRLGTVPHGERVFARFVLRNPGNRPLRIRQVVVSCACAYLNLQAVSPDGDRRDALAGPRGGIKEQIVLRPGEWAEAFFRYETAERAPLAVDLEEPVHFYLDHPRRKVLDGVIKLRVKSRFKFTPPRPDFGIMGRSQRGSCRIKLTPHPGDDTIRILGFKGTSAHFRARTLVEEPAGTVIELTAGPDLDLGRHLFPLVIRTGVAGGYDLPLNITGTVVPDLHLDPAPPLPLTNRGPGGTLENTLLIRWHRPGPGLALEVREVRGAPAEAARLEELESGRLWRLRVRVRREVPGPFAGTVLVGGGEEGEESVEIPFKGMVHR